MEIKIEKIIYPGKSLGFSGTKTILTNEGIPGEIVEVIPLEEKKNYTEAKTVKIITSSSARVTPACSHYQACSPYQYIDYKTQLAIKESQLREIFPNNDIVITPSPEIWGYRNKIELNIIWKDKQAFLGYHTPESRYDFLRADSCFLASENIHKLLASFIELVNKENLDFIKEVKIRESWTTKDLMLTIQPYGKIEKFPGKPYIEEKISEKTFRIGPESFFQINIPMLETALKEIEKYLNPEKKERIADLYCGIGTFGIMFSRYAKEIIGIESSPDNISFLKSNLKLNNINNFKLYEGDCEKLFPPLMTKGIDILMLDPPRKGLDNMLCQNILLSSIKKIIYLSCNPATLSRDLKILGQKYTIKTLHMFDFFPHTPHIETLAILEKKQL